MTLPFTQHQKQGLQFLIASSSVGKQGVPAFFASAPVVFTTLPSAQDQHGSQLRFASPGLS
jgi:hypothetical protein